MANETTSIPVLQPPCDLLSELLGRHASTLSIHPLAQIFVGFRQACVTPSESRC
jgi:hypothetical protein